MKKTEKKDLTSLTKLGAGKKNKPISGMAVIGYNKRHSELFTSPILPAVGQHNRSEARPTAAIPPWPYESAIPH